MTWDEIIQLATGLPEVAVGTSYGTPALKVRGKLLTRLRPEDNSLVLLDVDVDERAMLIAAEPGIFHTTPHYDGYPAVLVHLEAVEPEIVRSFLERRWRHVAPRRVIAQFDARHGSPGSS